MKIKRLCGQRHIQKCVAVDDSFCEHSSFCHFLSPFNEKTASPVGVAFRQTKRLRLSRVLQVISSMRHTKQPFLYYITSDLICQHFLRKNRPIFRTAFRNKGEPQINAAGSFLPALLFYRSRYSLSISFSKFRMAILNRWIFLRAFEL